MKYICLFFARGCCPYGWECEYRHTLPDEAETTPDTSKDCFARDKFSDYRDDMGGVGSFNRQNRTLYVGRIKEVGTGPETEEVVVRHFREWGVIEKGTFLSFSFLLLSADDCPVRVLQYRSVAFVTYVSELNAQFAKESMACQSLDNDEILNVRWATEDPNPVSKVAEKRRLEELGQEAIKSRMDPRIVDAMRAVRALEDGHELIVEDEQEDEEPDPKRRRIALEVGAVPTESDEAPATPPQVVSLQTSSNPPGLLTSDTLEGLKYFAEIRKRHSGTAAISKQRLPPPSSMGLGLADYGSDDED